jgi:hypothetical protein
MTMQAQKPQGQASSEVKVVTPGTTQGIDLSVLFFRLYQIYFIRECSKFETRQ